MIHEWAFWARPDQLPPTKTDWTTWLVLGGRGAGKTRTGAEWIAAQVKAGAQHVAIVGETYEDAREVMIAGPSGLCAIGDPASRPVYEPSRHRLSWPNGAEGHVFSADDPDGLRGFQFEASWADEICKWRQPDAAWSNLQLGLRLGDRPRQVVTTTPRPFPLLKRLMEHPSTTVTRSTTYDNKGHLASAFLDEIATIYEGTALGRQELLGELIEDQDGALWTWGMIEAARVQDAPALSRIVIAVDPPVTSGPEADECGLIIAGLRDEEGRSVGYVLRDASVAGLSPRGWAARAVSLYHQYKADRLVVEVNQGGDLVEQIIQLEDPNIAIRKVRASRGKMVRAEPIAALYEQGRVRHAGTFPKLEDQLTSYIGQVGEVSPDRLDALVWALTDLMLSPQLTPSIRSL